MGELLVEIMRPRAGMPLGDAAEFLGPFPSGAPAIFIDTVARLGHPAGIIGGVGDDDFGRCLVNRLMADGVDCSHVLHAANRSTAVAFVTYFKDGSRKFIFHIDGTPAVMADAASAAGIEDPGFFHIMGCSLMANESFGKNIIRTMTSFHGRGARISFDPNIRIELLGDRKLECVVAPVLEKCSVFFPGAAELALLTREKDIEKSVQKVFETWPVEIVVVKRGRRGSIICTRSSEVQVPAYPIEEVDPTGAGDCFDGAFLCGMLDKSSLEECGRLASAAGALNAAAFGPMEGTISKATIEEVMRRGYPLK
jgi:sugar/nucleoside kinase (ribokinase family)